MWDGWGTFELHEKSLYAKKVAFIINLDDARGKIFA